MIAARLCRRAAAALLSVVVVAEAVADETFLAPTRDAELYLRAIDAERPAAPPPAGVTGITAPHHLVAADLMARAFWSASAGSYDRIILLAPDHFRAVDGPFGTIDAPFDTVFGPIAADGEAVAALLADTDLFEPLDAAEAARDHGLQALTPLIRRFWPEARLIPVLGSIWSGPGDWAAAAERLAPFLGPRTLVVQSTDFSHYLGRGVAALRDQESLGVIAAGRAEGVAALGQPGHLDSKAAMAVQMRLQGRLGARPTVIGNRNQVDYGGRPDSTTSYVVAVWSSDPALGAALDYADQEVVYFAGDTLLGRYLAPLLTDRAASQRIVEAVRGVTRGRPLVVNLEGPVLEDRPVAAPPGAHLMMADVALPLLDRLGVRAAGMANNHARDLGAVGLAETGRLLDAAGIAAMAEGRVHDIGPLRVLPLTLLRNDAPAPHDAAADAAVRTVCAAEAAPPLVIFVHWGREWTDEAGEAERALAARFADCGAAAVIGAHSHQASDEVEALAGGATQMVYSLGNFIFDQSGQKASGALAEVRVFGQSTVAVRLIPIPNFFDMLRGG